MATPKGLASENVATPAFLRNTEVGEAVSLAALGGWVEADPVEEEGEEEGPPPPVRMYFLLCPFLGALFFFFLFSFSGSVGSSRQESPTMTAGLALREIAGRRRD